MLAAAALPVACSPLRASADAGAGESAEPEGAPDVVTPDAHRSSEGGACRIAPVKDVRAALRDVMADAATPAEIDCGDVVSSIIDETCVGTICHHAGPVQAARLDLLSPCVADRLVGVVSTCNGRLLADPERPEESYLLEKLERDAPECGVRMPYENQLPPAELACMRGFIFAISQLR